MTTPNRSTPNSPTVPSKLLIYVMPDTGQGHGFTSLRRTRKNNKDRYVTAEEFSKFGLLWPTPVGQTREELAQAIGLAILDEIGV